MGLLSGVIDEVISPYLQVNPTTDLTPGATPGQIIPGLPVFVKAQMLPLNYMYEIAVINLLQTDRLSGLGYLTYYRITALTL